MLYAQLYSSKSQTSNHIILFKAINKYNITSQEALKKHFREQAIYKKMAQVKSYLYEDILELNDQIREKVHTIIAIGESKHKVKAQLSEVVPNLIEVCNRPLDIQMDQH